MTELAQAVARALDPVELARACGIEPEPWQVLALRSQALRSAYCCARQSGKTTIASLIATHQLLYAPGSLVLTLAPSERQAQEVFRRIVGFWKRLGRPIPAESEQATQLVLANGSQLRCLPASESRIRGFTPDLLLVDESARVPDELWHATLPMIAARPEARVLTLSTPFGVAGWWSDIWHRAEGWERTEITADQVPHISPAFLREAEASMPRWAFLAEFYCTFTDTAGDSAFPLEIVLGSVSEEVEAWTLAEQ